MRGGLMEVLMVFENLAGARHREILKFPTRNRVETIRRLARHLAARGDITHMDKLRLRIEERNTLKDDPVLRRLLVSEFKFHREDDGL